MTSAPRPLPWREITILLAAKVAALSCLYFLFFDPSHRRRREITILLAVKVVALSCLYFLFFDPSHRPLADTGTVSAHIMSADR